MPPRKPIVILGVEGLSDGRPIDMDGPQTDDFTQEPIPRVWPDARPKAPLPSAQEIINARNVAKRKANEAMLVAVGILKPKATPKAPVAPAHGAQRPLRVVRVVLKCRDWRRI
jgi:hypothetical protein